MLDLLKVVPVGNLLFDQDVVAYAADLGEVDRISAVLRGRQRDPDPIIEQLVVGEYHPNDVEREELQRDGLPTDRLFLLNPRRVFRHTDTRSQYQRFATVRMRSVFELLDLKAQLRWTALI